MRSCESSAARIERLLPHLREQKWIAQRAKTRPQESLNFVSARNLFPKSSRAMHSDPTNLVPRNRAAI
jgi:hypothetical protein